MWALLSHLHGPQRPLYLHRQAHRKELYLQACEDREALDVDNDNAKGHQLVVELAAFKQRH